ncbi:MAG: hypothetical protein RM022_012155 [Nostoc sp. EfeVER01]|nr:hypothetical protein [Nostoc sp. EfeVER01]MDZ7945616.1 hypothetical protein [Nostoc sp. EfeVER01]
MDAVGGAIHELPLLIATFLPPLCKMMAGGTKNYSGKINDDRT